MLIVAEPQLLRAILVRDFDHFTNHHDILLPAEQEPLLGNALLMLKDQKWRDMRSTMSAAFTGSKMRQMFVLIRRTVDGTVAAMRAECEAAGSGVSGDSGDYVPELKDRFVRFMTDVIASTAFGVEINSLLDRDNVFFTMGQRAIAFRLLDLVKVGLMALLPGLSRLFGVQLFAPAIHRFFHRLVHDAIAERQRSGVVQRPDIIHLLMETRRSPAADRPRSQQAAEDAASPEGAFAIAAEATAGELRPSGQRAWTDAELTSQCFLFFVAGFETSSTVLSCVAQELAENPNVQRRLRAEIDEVRSSLDADGDAERRVDYERLQRMPYMDMVVSEALRKWPPTATTDRVCVKPYELVSADGRRLRMAVGDVLMVPMLGMHRDERFYPDPMRFDPERFAAANRHLIEPFAYLPFGGGPRSCIGKWVSVCALQMGVLSLIGVVFRVASRFALITIKAMLFELLTSFELLVAPSTQIPLRLLQRGFATSAERGFNVHLQPRA